VAQPAVRRDPKSAFTVPANREYHIARQSFSARESKKRIVPQTAQASAVSCNPNVSTLVFVKALYGVAFKPILGAEGPEDSTL
jgi:hypothetical protein